MKAAAAIIAVFLDVALAWVIYWAILCSAEFTWHPWVATLVLCFILRAVFTFLMGVSLGQFLSGLRPGLAGIPGRLSGLLRAGAEILLLWAIPGELALLCQKRLTWAERLAQAPLQLASTPKTIISFIFAAPVAILLLLWAPALAINPQWPTMMPENITAMALSTAHSPENEKAVASSDIKDDWWHSAYFAFDAPMPPNALAVPSFKIIRETQNAAVKVFPEAIVMQPNLVARISVQGSYFWPDFIPALASKDAEEQATFFKKAFQKMRHPRLFRAWHWAAFAQAQSALTKILPYPVPAQGQIIRLGDTTFLRLHQDLRPLAIPDRQAADVLLPLSKENPTVLEIIYQGIDQEAIFQWPFKFWPEGTKWDLASKTNVEIPAEAFPPPEQFTVWQIFDFYMAPLASTQTDLLEGFIFHYFYDLGQRPLPEFAQEQVRLALTQLDTAAQLLGQNTTTAKFSPTYFKSLRDLEVSIFKTNEYSDDYLAHVQQRALASQNSAPEDSALGQAKNLTTPAKNKTTLKTKLKEVKTEIKKEARSEAKDEAKNKNEKKKDKTASKAKVKKELIRESIEEKKLDKNKNKVKTSSKMQTPSVLKSNSSRKKK